MTDQITLASNFGVTRTDCPAIFRILVENSFEDFKKYVELCPEEINSCVGSGKYPLIQIIADTKYLDHLKFLIEKKVDLNKVDAYGQTALFDYIYYDAIEAAKLLIQAGADVNIMDKYKNTALSRASRFGNVEFVKLLLDAGADPLISTPTALSEAKTLEIKQLITDAINKKSPPNSLTTTSIYPSITNKETNNSDISKLVSEIVDLKLTVLNQNKKIEELTKQVQKLSTMKVVFDA